MTKRLALPINKYRRIHKAIQQRLAYEKELERLDKLFAPRIKAFQDSERITEEDLKIIIH